MFCIHTIITKNFPFPPISGTYHPPPQWKLPFLHVSPIITVWHKVSAPADWKKPDPTYSQLKQKWSGHNPHKATNIKINSRRPAALPLLELGPRRWSGKSGQTPPTTARLSNYPIILSTPRAILFPRWSLVTPRGWSLWDTLKWFSGKHGRKLCFYQAKFLKHNKNF